MSILTLSREITPHENGLSKFDYYDGHTLVASVFSVGVAELIEEALKPRGVNVIRFNSHSKKGQADD
jgi:hypothetical protein